LGISDYEGRTYSALLAHHPATAYEAAKASGVPTSKVYEVLDRLEARGMVRGFDDEGRRRYLPQPAEDFVEATRRQLSATLDGLKDELLLCQEPRETPWVWNVREPATLLDKAERLIVGARSTLLVSAWTQEALLLSPLLAQARARGVKTALVHFGVEGLTPEGQTTLGGVFHHPIEDTIYAEKGGRGLTVVADSSQALTATFQDDGAEGAWSQNHSFVTLAEDYIKHDIYIMKIVARFDPEMQARFGPGYQRLRDVWNDEELP
jgi:predicted transcriptional regulator